jgi:Flp pilus assembly protein CpaB
LNSRVRNGIIIAILGVGLIVFGIFITSRLLQNNLAPLPPAEAKAADTVQVLVAAHPIAAGMVLQLGDVNLVDVPVGLAPSGTLDNVESAVGSYAMVDLAAGEMVLDQKLADPTNTSQGIGLTLGDDEVLLAFPADDLMSTLSFIQRGDQVDIFATIEQKIPAQQDQLGAIEGEEPATNEVLAYTFDALQRVKITAKVVEIVKDRQTTPTLNVKEGDEQTQPEQTETRAYLLALSSQDALALKHLKDTGAMFDLVLRNPKSNQLYENVPITTKYLFDRYLLEGPR